MAINPNKKIQKQKYLLIAFIIILAITLFVVWQGFLKESSVSYLIDEDAPILRRVNIDYQILEKVREMRLFERIEPLPETERIGRENPFVPYYAPERRIETVETEEGLI